MEFELTDLGIDLAILDSVCKLQSEVFLRQNKRYWLLNCLNVPVSEESLNIIKTELECEELKTDSLISCVNAVHAYEEFGD